LIPISGNRQPLNGVLRALQGPTWRLSVFVLMLSGFLCHDFNIPASADEAGSPAARSYVSVCRDASSGAEVSAKMFSYLTVPTGAPFSLTVSEQPPEPERHCDVLTLPVPASAVVWARVIPPDIAARLQGGVSLVSEQAEKPTRFAEVLPVAEAAPQTPTQPPLSAHPILSFKGFKRKPEAATYATWLWQPALWQGDHARLWPQLVASGIGRIYITVPVDPETNRPVQEERLQAFIREASTRNIRVWAVDGDPHDILDEARENLIARACAYAAYNRKAEPNAQLAGIQYDIEPYLLPGFDLNPAEGYQAYLQTFQTLRRAVSLPIDVVMPFWTATIQLGDSALLEQLTPWVDGITVMDYRTDPGQIRRFAQPFLDWAARSDRRVQIALESGPLPDEWHYAYRPAGMGELWQLQVKAWHVLLLLDAPRANPLGAHFAYSHKVRSGHAQTTFQGERERLKVLLPGLNQDFKKHPGYVGLALHGYFDLNELQP
jgi:hypothetical protein